MKVLLTGSAGNLGSYLLRAVPSGIDVVASYRNRKPDWPQVQQLDLAEPGAAARAVAVCEPDLILHTAYSTADLERDVVAATQEVTEAAVSSGCRLVYMSTDALFDGRGGPYLESHEPTPNFPYGDAKARAELHVRKRLPNAAVIRTSLILGLSPISSSSAWIAKALRNDEEVTLYVDELRRPIAAADLAALVWEIAGLPSSEAAGVWHLVGGELLSRYAIGLLLAQYLKLDASKVLPALAADCPAPRPLVLDLLSPRAGAALSFRPRPLSQVLTLPQEND